MKPAIERFVDAVEELKPLMTEAHATIKDLRLAIKEARALSVELRSIGTETVDAAMREAVTANVATLAEATKQATDRAVDRITRRFEQLEKMIFAKPGSPTLEDLVSRIRRAS